MSWWRLGRGKLPELGAGDSACDGRKVFVNAETVTLQLPASLYADLAELASENRQDPVAIIAEWVEEVRQRRLWQQGWADLRAAVQKDGGFSPDTTAEEIVALTRRSR